MARPERPRIAELYAEEPIARKGGVGGTLSILAFLYRSRLRSQPVQELLALIGIAAGVALLFAVQVANKSVTGSFDQLARGITGKASLEVAARGPDGVNQGLFRKVERLPDVASAAPLLERRIGVVGPKGRRPLTLVGVDDRLARMKGKLVRRFSASARKQSQLGFYLPGPAARAIGVGPAQDLKVQAGERTVTQPLAGTLSSEDIGPLAQSPVAVAALPLAQEIAAMPERITRVLVEPKPGRETQARAELKRVAADRLNVRPSNSEAKLLNEAAKPNQQSSQVFSAISLVVGLLLAYNAMLLTVARRRRTVAYLRMQGAKRSTVVAALIFDASLLGLAGSLVGLVLGDLLSRYVLHDIPGFLASAFAIGSQRVVTTDIVLLSVAGGVVATLAAAARPAIEQYAANPVEATYPEDLHKDNMQSSRTRDVSFWIGVVTMVVTTIILLLAPGATAAGIGVPVGVLVLAIVMVLPATVIHLLSLGQKFAHRHGGAITNISLAELIATPARATALAAIGALAVFAILSIGGSARDIRRGADRSAIDFYPAGLWITPKQQGNTFVTQPFSYRAVAQRLRRLPSVDAVRVYRTSFLDVGSRRLWVIARPPGDPSPVSPSQLTRGNKESAFRHLRQGGWAALSATVADERNLSLGDRFTLPTPTGNRLFKLAATITNYGWPSGAVVMNGADYRHLWNKQEASVLKINLAQDVSSAEGMRAVQDVLGPGSALRVQTIQERRAEIAKTTSQGMTRLDQISKMVLVVAVLAVVAAMLTSVWQRRPRLAGLRAIGMYRGELYKALFLETAVILLIGCLIGAIFGLYGQVLDSRWVQLSTGFPAPFYPAWAFGIRILLAFTLLAVAATALPAYFAARVSPGASFSYE